MEDSYPTDAYDPYPADEPLAALAYGGTTLPAGLLEDSVHSIPEEILAAFDTQKVALKGTLQRLKARPPRASYQEYVSDSEEETGDGKEVRQQNRWINQGCVVGVN